MFPAVPFNKDDLQSSKLSLTLSLFLAYAKLLNLTHLASYVLDVSHSSAISSRTTYSCAELIVTVYRCRNWAVVLYPLASSNQRELTKPLYDNF